MINTDKEQVNQTEYSRNISVYIYLSLEVATDAV